MPRLDITRKPAKRHRRTLCKRFNSGTCYAETAVGELEVGGEAIPVGGTQEGPADVPPAAPQPPIRTASVSVVLMHEQPELPVPPDVVTVMLFSDARRRVCSLFECISVATSDAALSMQPVNMKHLYSGPSFSLHSESSPSIHSNLQSDWAWK